MKKKLLLFAVLSLIVMSAQAQLKRSAMVHAPTYPQAQLVKPEAKMERAVMRQPGTPVVKPPKKAGSVDVWYRRPAGAFAGSVLMEDRTWVNTAYSPFIFVKPYSEYTFNGYTTGVSDAATFDWDVFYNDGKDFTIAPGKDLTWKWGYEENQVPIFYADANDGVNSWDWCIKGTYNDQEYTGLVYSKPYFWDEYECDLLVSSKTFCWGGRYGDQDYVFTYYWGLEPYSNNEYGWWFGKNGGTSSGDHIDGIAQAFEKPEHPYLLKQVVVACNILEVAATMKMTCKIYKLNGIPAYDDNNFVTLPEVPGELICEGEATVTPSTFDDTGGLVTFTLLGEEDGITYEYTPTIEDAILVVIDGYNDPSMANLTDFSAMISSDDQADEGFGELAYLKYGTADGDYYWAGLNNFFGGYGTMKTGLTIFLNIDQPFLIFNNENEDGQYTFPAEGGLMEKDLGDGPHGIEFRTSTPSEDGNWWIYDKNLNDVPDWLIIELNDNEDETTNSYVVDAVVTAEPLPAGVDYRKATVEFFIPGAAPISYTFKQGGGSNPGEANYYIVGAGEEFGDWHTNAGAKMSQNSGGTYSYTATIDGAFWFVFANGLTEWDGDWDTFNSQYRYGPTGGGDETVEAGKWYTTQKQGNGNGAYKFVGNGSEYVFTFNPYISKFKIEGDVTPLPQTYTVAGSPGSIFGTEWDPTNRNNDMVKQDDGTYMLQKNGCELYAGETIMFKVVSNRDWSYSWPSDNINIFIGENGTYDFTVTFNPANEEIDYELKKQGSTKLPVEAPEILWEVNDDAVNVTVAVPETDGELVYTGEYSYPRTNVDQTYNVEAYTLETEAYQESEHATATIWVPAKQEVQGATGELAFQGDGYTPATLWQPSEDHIFARNEYTDDYGNTVMMDNLVSFKDNTTQLVWLWLNDDEIYCNESVQSLTPIAYNSAGDLYNEITYNSCQIDIYLPNDVTLVNASSSESYIGGDRLPSTSTVYWTKIDGTKTIDGITYNVYRLVIYNSKAYGSHFSGKDASMYEERGALKKDDAPLLGLWLECSDQSGNEMPDMIIANQIFSLRETSLAGWDANASLFFYGTGGNNESQRFQLYNRVRLVDDYEQATERTEKPVITADFTEDAVIVSAIGEGVVKLYKEGVLVENPYTVARTNVDQFITFTATAQEEGKLISETETIEICVPAKDMTEQTPAPEITTTMTDNSVVVTATGEGEVKLYIDGVEVSNPYTINRGTEDKTYTATATAQADGLAISETTIATIEVPKMDGDGSYLYINDYQIPASKLGDEIVLPLRAHFDARVSGWLVEMTFPEGITPVYCESGGATTITYLDARGTQQTVKASFTPGPTNTNILSYLGTAGFWLPEGATEYESYGVVKWEAGDYGEMALIYCQVDPNFTGGQLSIYSELSSGNDTRGGTIPNQNHTYTTNLTIGGQELQGEVLIGDCDANGKVPVSYNGSENVTLDVMIDGQSVPVIDGMVQLKHYGRSIVSAEVTAIGYAPLHVNAEVNWVAINNGDWEILKAFYNQYQNDVLVWDMSDRNKPGSCPGVSSENGRVTAIVLPNHELEGGFPTMLLALNKLTVLDLSYNNLSGDAAADMTQYAAASGIKANGLLELYIHHNDFTGNVGALASLFSDLETLNVSNNHFGQVDPMVNPAVNLSLNNQLLEMNGDITNGLGVLATSLPTICLYDHAGQTFSWDAEITLNDKSQSPEWNMELWLEDNEVYYSNVSGPYRGTNGQSLSGNSRSWGDDGSCNEQLLQVLFSFNLGDANFNGPVDITDLQAMVNYIFGDYYRLFNFTAANLNNDAIVNVQDVVGEANLLLSMELTMPTLRRAPSTDVDLADASLYWENGTLYLNTTVPVTALDIVNDAEGDITWNVDNLGFVVKHATGPQGAHSVIYSLGDAVIEPGVTAIATTTGRTPNVVAAKLSNADAELVDVRLNDRMTGLKSLTEDGKPQCHINGTNLVITNGTDLNDVDIDIYTVDGKLVWGKHVNRLESGTTSIDLSDIGNDHRYYIIVVRNGRQIIATKKLTQIR